MISLKITLDQRRIREDRTYSIVFRLTYNGKSRDISTGMKSSVNNWDFRACNFKLNTQGTSIDSERLREKRLQLMERILEYERKVLNSNSEIQEIKDFIIGKKASDYTLKIFWQEEIQRQTQAKNYGNAKNYHYSYKSLSKIAKLDISIEKIDFAWLVNAEAKLKESGVGVNSISVYLRCLRALYNKAIHLGIVEPSSYPFKRYKIKNETTLPRVASIEELQKYFSLPPDINSVYFDHWNYGRMIFLLRGISFIDLALLTRDNIKHDRIVYKRAKTHKDYSIRILPITAEIISYYHHPERTTLLPILNNEEYKNKSIHPDRIRQQIKNTNKWLNRYGKSLGIKEDLSTYVFK